MTKIEWTDSVFNPVWGCENSCPFCYARKIAKRFYKGIAEKEFNCQNNDNRLLMKSIEFDLKNFYPTWIESNFQKKFPKKPKRIFVNSMSDIAFWKPEWMNRTLEKIKKYPWHTFQILTKFPETYSEYNFPENCWLGVTYLNQQEIIPDKNIYKDYKNVMFISFEPMQSDLYRDEIPDGISWIIIGAETGNRKDKIIPKPEWIKELVDIDMPLFMKDNLRLYWSGKFRQEFPK